MNNMREAISTLLKGIKSAIVEDMKDVRSDKGWKTFKMVLAAYNSYQESERDGVDYIFDIENTEDVICFLKGGMTSKEVCSLFLGSNCIHTKYFLFGCNYEEAKAFNDYEEVAKNLIAWLDDVLAEVIAYPYSYDSYRELYTWYMTDVVIGYKHDSAFDFGNATLSDLDALAALKRKLEMND